MVINERDRMIMNEVSRWKSITGREVRLLCGFKGARACDRRLSKLIDEGLLIRQKYIYGVAGLLSITPKAKKIFGIELSPGEQRLEQIIHDIAVTDTAIYFMNKYELKPEQITTEKQIRHIEGFGVRKHLPDFVFTRDRKKYCVEVELSVKSGNRLSNNIQQNYMTYDGQKWVVSESHVKIRAILTESQKNYPDIEIIDYGEIEEYIMNLLR